MAFRFDCQLTGVSDLLKMKAYTDPKLYEKAIKGGLSYASRAVPTAAAKSIRERYNIGSARIKQDIKGPFIAGDQATIIFSRKPPSALQYGGKDPMRPGRGLSVMVQRGQRKPVARGFIVRSGSLQGKPFQRVSNDPNSKIRFVSGPSIGSIVLRNSAFGQLIRTELQLRMNEQFIKGYQRILDSAARGYGAR